MFADDGKESEVFHVDNDGSSTRVGMKGAARATDDLSAGFKFEVEFEGNSSNDVSMNKQDTDASFKKAAYGSLSAVKTDRKSVV